MWPSVVVHKHWPVSQRMIVEMGGYAWSEHIVTIVLACPYGDGSNGLMKVAFCYALPTVVQEFGGNERLHFRTPTPPNAKLSRSAPAVLNGRCRARVDMSRSSLGVVLRGLPARGRSVTLPV
jgi:hypothetical protein